MAFRSANLNRLVKFNSSTSSDFIDSIEKYSDDRIAAQNNEPSHRTFAPSSFRCPRVSFFRLRGTQPDKIKSPDKTLDFVARLGTAIHEYIQTDLEDLFGDKWIDVETHLNEIDPPYQYELKKKEHETMIATQNPPVTFACDGIIELNGERYLLEIKSSEHTSFDELMNPKPIHIDQVKFYGTFLQLKKALVLYVDRQYGSYKCYEVDITQADNNYIWNKINYVTEMVDCNLIPEGLPAGDPNCNPNMCKYYYKCTKDWGK